MRAWSRTVRILVTELQHLARFNGDAHGPPYCDLSESRGNESRKTKQPVPTMLI